MITKLGLAFTAFTVVMLVSSGCEATSGDEAAPTSGPSASQTELPSPGATGGDEDGEDSDQPEAKPAVILGSVSFGKPVTLRAQPIKLASYLENQSDSDLEIGPAEIVSNSGAFTFEDGSTVSELCGGMVPANDTCTFIIIFDLVDVGSHSFAITVPLPAFDSVVTAEFGYEVVAPEATFPTPSDFLPDEQPELNLE